MMIMIMKTSGSQVDSPVAEGNRKEGGGRKMRDLPLEPNFAGPL